MERVKTLIEKLQKQADQNAAPSSMLATLQLLQAELLHNEGATTRKSTGKVAIIMPTTPTVIIQKEGSFIEPLEAIIPEEDKIIEILRVDEEEIQKELDEIKKHANSMHSIGTAQAVNETFDPIEDVPTLAQQDPKPVSDRFLQGKIEYPEIPSLEESLNDKLKQDKVELSESLTTTPIKDLRKAISINDRFVFIEELFRGDESMYERSIKTIQSFSIFAEAEFWIRRELRLKLGWKPNDPAVRQFDELVRRRFL